MQGIGGCFEQRRREEHCQQRHISHHFTIMHQKRLDAGFLAATLQLSPWTQSPSDRSSCIHAYCINERGVVIKTTETPGQTFLF